MTIVPERRIITLIISTFFLFLFFIPVTAQKKARNTSNLVYIDQQGVLRYSSNNKEAAFFGVNYTTPFAYAYRAHKALGVDLERAIQNDVYHFARLGLDAFRVHVWDTEISDSAGNLMENEHLRLFDFLLAELKKRNIKTIITPIAFWGNGYPERDESTPGFSRYYGRGKLTTNDTAIKAQENYLRQLFKHVNPYTRLSYEADKDIIAAELNNEPSHSGPKQGVTDYINRLSAALKSTGWSKPVFYNIAQGPYYSDAVAASVVDGFSFQWYPTGLVGNQTLKGNALPNVDKYQIPFRYTVAAFAKKALMVYEFDAADVFDSYMYPAMARSFRGAGLQWATQFAYDPMALAYANTEYQTHYLNLAYTPSKAISMLIASEVFHRLPRLKSYGAYPADIVFDVFRVSYAASLSEMNAADKFYHSNTTSTIPVNRNQLQHIAGVGSSPVVHYQGSGAYFIDKLQDGVWRLEVMPDAIYIRDPFEKASPKKEVTAIKWAANDMQISLDDLGPSFSIKGLNERNSFLGKNNQGFQISPGTYLLTKNSQSFDVTKKLSGDIGLTEFVAPAPSKTEIVVRHQPFTDVSAGKAFTIQAIIGGLDSGKALVQLTRAGGGLFRTIEMRKSGGGYIAEIPAELVTTGQLEYRIIVQQGNDYTVYPGNIKSNPFAWDNYLYENYTALIAATNSPLELYNPLKDRSIHLLPNFRRGFQSNYISGSNVGSLALKLGITEMKDDEIMGFQYFIGDKLKQRITELPSFGTILLRGSSTTEQPVNVTITLVNKNGMAFSSTAQLTGKLQEIALPLANLKSSASLLMPRPYPDFQPLYFNPSFAGNETFNLAEIEKIAITTSPSLHSFNNKAYGLVIEWIRLVNLN